MMNTTSRPYLIRAIYEWIVDNEMTPYIVVNAEYEGVQLPFEYVEEGKMILNISPEACRGLHMENDRVIFTAKFGGEAFQIYFPPEAAMALYANENGRGMIFDGAEGEGPEVDVDQYSDALDPKKMVRKKGKPHLKLIKAD